MINVVDKQRYNTAGDYYATSSGWQFAVSKQKSVDDEFLILIHELVEWYLTQRNGIREEDITAFHVANPSSRDPGSDPAPRGEATIRTARPPFTSSMARAMIRGSPMTTG